MCDNGGVKTSKGIIGFSQGARLVPGIVLRQKIEERYQGRSKYSFSFWDWWAVPAYLSLRTVDTKDYELLKQVPTVHVWGRDDHLPPSCVELMKAGESDQCFQIDFAGQHLP